MMAPHHQQTAVPTNHVTQPTYTMLLDTNHMDSSSMISLPTDGLEPVAAVQPTASWSPTPAIFTQLTPPKQLVEPKNEFVKPKVHLHFPRPNQYSNHQEPSCVPEITSRVCLGLL